jgi:hypothetical protein
MVPLQALRDVEKLLGQRASLRFMFTTCLICAGMVHAWITLRDHIQRSSGSQTETIHGSVVAGWSCVVGPEKPTRSFTGPFIKSERIRSEITEENLLKGVYSIDQTKTTKSRSEFTEENVQKQKEH